MQSRALDEALAVRGYGLVRDQGSGKVRVLGEGAYSTVLQARAATSGGNAAAGGGDSDSSSSSSSNVAAAATPLGLHDATTVRHRLLALKVSRLGGGVSDAYDNARVRVDARVMHALRGTPPFLPLLDVWEMSDDARCACSDCHRRDRSSYMCALMPQCDSTLTALCRHRALSEDEQRSVVRQLLAALALLHAHGVMHRDVKPDNVLVSTASSTALGDGSGGGGGGGDTLRVHLSDFNLVAPLPPPPPPPSQPPTPQPLYMQDHDVVTRWYRSPELLLRAPYGAGVDVWAAACTLVECLVLRGKPFLAGRTVLHQAALIFSTVPHTADATEALWGAATMRTVEREARAHNLCMLRPRQQQQPSSQAPTPPPAAPLAHAWSPHTPPAGLADLLSRMLALDPAERLTAQQALQHPWLQQGGQAPCFPMAVDAALAERLQDACAGVR